MPSPVCARCGYDLSGAVSVWADDPQSTSCPVRGTCSECGHDFAWTDVLHPERRVLAGFIEHDPAPRERGGGAGSSGRSGLAGRVYWWRRLTTTAWRTLWWALTMTLWRRLSVDHAIRPRRWIVWLMLTLGAAHLVAAGLGFARWAVVLNARAAGGGRGVPLPGGPPGVGGPPAVSLNEWIGYAVSALGYPVLVVPRTAFGPGAAGLVTPMLRDWPAAVWLTIGTQAMFTLLVLILPSARRAVGVHSGHVWRAAVYGLAWIPALAVFRAVRNVVLMVQVSFQWRGGGAMGRWGGNTAQPVRLSDFPEPLLVMGLVGWSLVWWLVVLRRGWGVRRAWMVWMVLAVPAVLSGVATAWWAYLLMG